MDNCAINCFEYKLKLHRNYSAYVLIAAADSSLTLTEFGWSGAIQFMSSHTIITLLNIANKMMGVEKSTMGNLSLCVIKLTVIRTHLCLIHHYYL